jgi:hypothetical protein
MHVGVERLPVDGKTVSCAWAHPMTGAELRIRFDRAPLRGPVKLGLALTDGAADNARASPVRADILIDGERKGSAETKPGRRGFVETTVSPSPASASTASSLEIVVTAADDGQRHTCFTVTTGTTGTP